MSNISIQYKLFLCLLCLRVWSREHLNTTDLLQSIAEKATMNPLTFRKISIFKAIHPSVSHQYIVISSFTPLWHRHSSVLVRWKCYLSGESYISCIIKTKVLSLSILWKEQGQRQRDHSLIKFIFILYRSGIWNVSNCLNQLHMCVIVHIFNFEFLRIFWSQCNTQEGHAISRINIIICLK